jgi:hypothetical protein
MTFGGVHFPVRAGAVKWSINFDSTTTGGFPAVALVYQLSSLAADGQRKRAASNGSVSWESNTPRQKMTTYYLPLASSSSSTMSTTTTLSVLLEVFDMALVDGTLVDIQHGVFAVGPTTGNYVLRLEFPAFTSSLHYDPSIGLARTKEQSGGGSSSGEDAGLIAGLVVGLVGGACLLGVVAVVIVVLVRRRTPGQADPWAHGLRPTTRRPWRSPRLTDARDKEEDDGL